MSSLIVYSTKYGFTKSCVEELEKRIKGDIKCVNIKENKLPDIRLYDTIIVGGSIYMGMLDKTIKKFCIENKTLLLSKKLGIFTTCSSIGEVAENQIKKNFDEDIYNHASAKDYLGGKIDLNKTSVFHSFIIKMVSKDDSSKTQRSNGLLYDRLDRFASKCI